MFSDFLNEFSESEFRRCTPRTRHSGAGRLTGRASTCGGAGLDKWHPASMGRPEAGGAKGSCAAAHPLSGKALGGGNAGFRFLRA